MTQTATTPTRTDASPSPTTVNFKRLFPILGFAAFLVGWDSMVVAPMAPAMMEGLHAGHRVASWLVSAYALTYFLFSPLCGAWSDHAGRKKVLLTGIAIFTVGTVLTGLMPGWWSVLAMRAVAGLGAGMIMPTVFALVSDNTPMESRGKAIGNVMAMLLASTIIGVPLGAFLSSVVSWRVVFLIIGACGAALLAWAAMSIPTVPGPHQIPVPAHQAIMGMLGRAFSTPSVLLTLAATFLWNAGLQTVFSSIGAFYAHQLGASQRSIALIILCAGIASVVGSIVGGRLMRPLGIRSLVLIAGILAAAGVLTLVLGVPHLVVVAAANVLWSLAIGIGQPCLTTLVSQLKPQLRGTALALNGSTQYAAMFFASLLGGTLATSQGNYLVAGIVSAVFAIATPLVVAAAMRVMSAPEDSSSPAS